MLLNPFVTSSFLSKIRNAAMYLDMRIHTLAYIRQRSSFLLAVVLAIATTYRSSGSTSSLNAQLMSHALRLESNAREQHFKSIEVVQGLLLLASFTVVPGVIAKDVTWKYISSAIALTVELRLDTPLPYCVAMDPLYSAETHDFLVRNAHRTCLLLYIHDRVRLSLRSEWAWERSDCP